ncbi:MAG: DegT/DnrJ/EryC1/StrS family aminotransferase [Calditrichaeota bacterium]|nr:DegT/DnrJ/EryC1/StrS family aminotransferase [Calditrichota bacterium]
MKIQQLDLKAQLIGIREELVKAIIEVVDSTQYIMGPQVVELEKQTAAYCGMKFGIGVASGTDALLVSLMALDVGPDDIVLTTPYSFFATAGVVSRCNAKPIFADIDADSYNLDPTATRRVLESLKSTDRKRVKVLLPVHLYGQSADMWPLMEIAEDFDLAVIEDGAQAIGAKYDYNGKPVKVGSIGLAGCFSFFPSKNLGGLGDGGIVVTNDEKFADQVRILRVHGARPKYYHSFIGGNFRLDTLQAAALLVKLPRLDNWHLGRQARAAYYDQHLAGIPGLKLPKVVFKREYHIYNQYIISVDKRDELQKHLDEKGISTAIYYPVPFHLQPCFQYLGYKQGDFPASEYAANHTLALPIYPELTGEQQDYVITAVREFLNA